MRPIPPTTAPHSSSPGQRSPSVPPLAKEVGGGRKFPTPLPSQKRTDAFGGVEATRCDPNLFPRLPDAPLVACRRLPDAVKKNLYNRPALSSGEALGFTTRSLHQCCRTQYSHSTNRAPRRVDLDLCLQRILMHGTAVGAGCSKKLLPQASPRDRCSAKCPLVEGSRQASVWAGIRGTLTFTLSGSMEWRGERGRRLVPPLSPCRKAPSFKNRARVESMCTLYTRCTECLQAVRTTYYQGCP